MFLGLAAIVVAYLIFWSVVYYVARTWFRFSREWAAPLASGISICGVSAAIATGAAIRARPVVPIMVSSLVVIFAVVELLILPFIAQEFLSHEPLVAGAWMALSVKTDGAAVASGAITESMILANNAAITKRVPMTEMDASDFRKIIDVDLTAQFICAKAVLPRMIEMGHGKIINLCSMMSELGRETISAYTAAKGGLKMLTRAICAEYGDRNIQCNGIGPGYIATPQTAPLREPQPDGSPHPFDSFLRARTPAGRWGTPEDLTGPAVFLASAASDFVNGHVLYVDGGILAYIGKQP
jgi:NAD(P)-dependent dehydrogenase (short-subunit alcohol dehydrogenase family)